MVHLTHGAPGCQTSGRDGYKILLFPPGWEEECVSPEKKGQKTVWVLWGGLA